MIRIKSNIAAFRAGLSRVQRSQLPFATAVALTETARDVEKDTVRRMPSVFDRPTPFTRRGLYVKPARKSRLVARVAVKDIQAKYLEIQEEGGVRTPEGRALVVPAGARLNAYGNLPRGAVRRYLARPDVFSGTIRGVGGIWQRKSRGRVKLLVGYEPSASYSPRFEFQANARRVAIETFGENFRKAFAKAVATARF